MSNDRNAGRKPRLTEADIADAKRRRSSGESVTSIAEDLGLSRQALYRYFNEEIKNREIRIDYYVGGELCSVIEADDHGRISRLHNYTQSLSKRAFACNDKPTLQDLNDLLEEYYFEYMGLTGSENYLALDHREDERELYDILRTSRTGGERQIRINGEDLPFFHFNKKDKVIRRTDTDGFQMKAITHDRRYFVKSQAIMSGVPMRDWIVEIIASDLCEQLGIPCVKQRACRFVYEGRAFDGVYSDNFELDGYTFISYERLLERQGVSSNDGDFIAADAMSKMDICAHNLAKAGGLPVKQTHRYMLDMALIDCLVGNVDRHTRNFGLFYNVYTGRYEIPMIFDNGMGLFEHDYYRDRYDTYEAAMNNVYVAPYGEDPFDMLDMLLDRYNLFDIYPTLPDLDYPELMDTPFAREYIHRIKEKLWRIHHG